jgi:hypothetical protein
VFAAAVLLLVPSAKSNTVTVDLGVVAYSIGVNASIDYVSGFTDTYTFQQLLFQSGPSYNLLFDSGLSFAAVLAQDLGNANNGTLDYNFPFIAGASGSYFFTGSPVLPNPSNPTGNIGPGILDSFTVATQSGTVCSGFNNVGATTILDPSNPAATFQTILGCESLAPLSVPPEVPTITVVTLPPLGAITSGGTVTVYQGEFEDTEYTNLPTAASAPEPSTAGFIILAIVGACATRRRKRQEQTLD